MRDSKKDEDDLKSKRYGEFYELVEREEELKNKLENAEEETIELIKEVVKKSDQLNEESNKVIDESNKIISEERQKLDIRKNNLKNKLEDIYETLNPFTLEELKRRWFYYYSGILLIFSLISLGILYFFGEFIYFIYLFIFYLIGIFFGAWYIDAKHRYDEYISDFISDLKKYSFSNRKIKNKSMKIKQKETDTNLINKWANVEKIIRGSCDFAKNKLPIAKEFLQTWDNLTRYENTVEDYISSLLYYGLPVSKYKKEVESVKPLSDEVHVWEEKIVKQIKRNLRNEGYGISKITIEFICSEHTKNQSKTNKLWRENKETIIPELTPILIDSDILPKPYKYTSEELEHILGNMSTFNLDELRDNIFEMSSVMNSAKSYLDFIDKNNIDYEKESIKKKIYRWFKETPQDKDIKEKKLSILAKLGFRIFKNYQNDFSDDKAEGIGLFSLALFYNNNVFYLEKACKKASLNKYAIKSTYVHLKLIKKFNEAGKGVPKIEDVINNFDLIDKNNERTKQEINHLRSSLQNGIWKTSYSHLIKDTMENKKLIDELKKDKKINEKIRKAMKNLFKDVKENTIERVLDAQLFSAYIISFDCRKGGIANILNSKPLRSKYKYKKYTDNSRVGIVLPEYDSFKEFKDDFIKDFNQKMQEEQQKWEEHMEAPNVNIQRITPSEHTFDTVNFELFEKVDYSGEKDFLEIVKELVKEEYPEEEIFEVLWYDREVDLLKILYELTILDLIYPMHEMTDKEEQILDSEQLWKRISHNTGHKRDKLTINIDLFDEEAICNSIKNAILEESREVGEDLTDERAEQFAKTTFIMIKRISSLLD